MAHFKYVTESEQLARAAVAATATATSAAAAAGEMLMRGGD